MKFALLLFMLIFVLHVATAQDKGDVVSLDTTKPTRKPDPKTVHKGELMPTIVDFPKAEFPKQALTLRLGAEIIVPVIVDKRGQVKFGKPFGPVAGICPSFEKDVRLAMLRSAALDAARKGAYKPAIEDGQPVDATAYVYVPIPYPPEEQKEPPDIGIMNGKALSLPQPNYPTGSMHFAGVVSVSVLIGEDGKPIRAIALAGAAGNPAFVPIALEAACNARFSPTLEDARPIRTRGTINYYFHP